MTKKEYIDSAFEAVWSAIADTLRGLQIKGDIMVRYRGHKRSILFDRTNQRLTIMIAKDGRIILEFAGYDYPNFWVTYATYDENEEKKKQQIDQFRETITMIIQDFCHDDVDWEFVMDCLSSFYGKEGWLDGYKEAREEWL